MSCISTRFKMVFRWKLRLPHFAAIKYVIFSISQACDGMANPLFKLSKWTEEMQSWTSSTPSNWHSLRHSCWAWKIVAGLEDVSLGVAPNFGHVVGPIDFGIFSWWYLQHAVHFYKFVLSLGLTPEWFCCVCIVYHSASWKIRMPRETSRPPLMWAVPHTGWWRVVDRSMFYLWIIN